MKFKVGDIIRGIDDREYNITNKKMTKGKVIGVGECDINIKILEHDESERIGGEYYVFPEYFELVEPAPFGKSDLQSGMRVRYRNGGERIVLRSDDEMAFTSFGGMCMDGSDYAEDLTALNEIGAEFDIVEVLKPKHLNEALMQSCELISIWKREEELIEITIEEIAEFKGVSPERIRIKEVE